MNNYLSEEEKRKAKMCVENIKDKLQAIESELDNDISYKVYLLEKIESICWDSNVIKSISEVKEND